jgi:hypothetical protein
MNFIFPFYTALYHDGLTHGNLAFLTRQCDIRSPYFVILSHGLHLSPEFSSTDGIVGSMRFVHFNIYIILHTSYSDVLFAEISFSCFCG